MTNQITPRALFSPVFYAGPKHEVNRITRCRDVAIRNFPRWLSVAKDHLRWRLGGLKCPVKFRIRLTYCFEDIENSIFSYVWLES